MVENELTVAFPGDILSPQGSNLMITKAWLSDASPPVPCSACGVPHHVWDLHAVSRGSHLAANAIGLFVVQPQLCMGCLTPSERESVEAQRTRLAELTAANDDIGDFCRCDACGEVVDDLAQLARREELLADAAYDTSTGYDMPEEWATLWVCRSCATPEESRRADAWKAEHAALERAERDGDDDSAFDRAREDDDLPF